jgi:hypothetical protein
MCQRRWVVRNRRSVDEKVAVAGEVTKPREQDNVMDEARPAAGVRWRWSDMEIDVKRVMSRVRASRRSPSKILHQGT